MGRTWIWILLLLVASRAYGQQPLLRVYVYDHAGVPASTLAAAEDSARRIFQRSGIGTSWFDCRGPAVELPRCGADNADVVMVRIIRATGALGPDVFGAAFLGTDGSGQYTTVFFNRAEEVHERAAVSLSEVLGHIIAHEIGHILLGFNAHTTLGIMRPFWDLQQLRDAERGRLLFTRDESNRIRRRLNVIASAKNLQIISSGN